MKQEEMSRWIKSFLITGIVFALFSLYLYLRRGYYNDYIVNKVFGSTSAVLAGLTLVIGPLGHRYRSFALLMPLRRELGLLALASTLVHVFFSVFVLSSRFPVTWYIKEVTPISFGGIAVAIWLYIATISSNKSIKSLGTNIWRWRQKVGGHVAFIAVYLHLSMMKYQGWLKWFTGQVKPSPELANPGYPPASTFVFLIMSGVIVYRLFLIIKPKNK